MFVQSLEFEKKNSYHNLDCKLLSHNSLVYAHTINQIKKNVYYRSSTAGSNNGCCSELTEPLNDVELLLNCESLLNGFDG